MTDTDTTKQVTVESRPALASYARVQRDEVRDRWVLQVPERILVLDDTSREIVNRCSGDVTVATIIKDLAREYAAPEEVIEHDVLVVLNLLAEKNFLKIDDV
jgi:pyrroloquinoline quinone biosynthesis protein D